MNYAEVEQRLLWAWNRVVAHQVSHRKDFAGLWQVDVHATRKALHALPPDDQAMYRHSLSGGLYTESYKAKWADQTDACKWCGQPDTLHHRYWTCPQHQDLRETHAPLATEVLDSIPPALALRGWSLFPHTWHAWISTLATLPTELPVPAIGLRPDCWNDVFTDGSCLFQSTPMYRLAAWSVVCAQPFSGSWTPGGSTVLGASFLPGICQTAYRAELFALAYTLHCAARARAPVRIWSDCLGVVTRFHQLFWGRSRLPLNRSNSDLWCWISTSLDTLGRDRVQLRKVPAHRVLSSARSKFEAWKFFHNAMADKAARLSNQARPPDFWRQWEVHAQATQAATVLYEQVKNLHIAIGRRNVRGGHEPDTVPAATPKDARCFVGSFDMGLWRGEALPEVSRLYGSMHVKRAIIWLLERLDLSPGAPVEWISFTQLHLDFQMSWGNPGPLRINGQWVDTSSRPYLDAERFPARQRTKWFRQFLKALFKEAKMSVHLEQCKPKSATLQSYLQVIALPWCPRALFEVENWLTTHLREPCVRAASTLKSLPLAAQTSSMRLELAQ